MRSVNIKKVNNSSFDLVLEFVNTFGVVVVKYKFINYVGNGDNLALACSEWVNYGNFIDNLKGLVKLDNE